MTNHAPVRTKRRSGTPAARVSVLAVVTVLLGAARGSAEPAEPGERPPHLIPALVLIVDTSAGMNVRMSDDNPKLDAVKHGLNQALLKYPEDCRLSLVVFGQRPGKPDPLARVLKPFVALDDPQRKLFMGMVVNLMAGGPDALGEALDETRTVLEAHKIPGRPKSSRFAGLILITGGAGADDGLADKVTRDLGADRVPVGLHVLGVDVQPARESGLKALARAGRGTFVNLKRAGEVGPELIRLRDELLSKTLDDSAAPDDPAGTADKPAGGESATGKPGTAGGVTAALIEGLRDDDVEARVKAANELASRNGPQVIAALGEALVDRDGRVRRAAADSLATIGDPAVIPLLIKRVGDNLWQPPPDGSFAYTDEPYDGFRGMGSKDHALAALERVAPERVREALLAAKKSQDVRVRTWAARELSSRPARE